MADPGPPFVERVEGPEVAESAPFAYMFPADEAGDDDIRAAERSRVVDMCGAMLPEEPFAKEPLVLWDRVRMFGNTIEMLGNWSFVGTGGAGGGEGGPATNPSSSRQVAGGEVPEGGTEREGAAFNRRHLLFGAASTFSWEGGLMGSSRGPEEGPAALGATWHLSMEQDAWRSPNVGWVSGSLTLQGLSSAQLAGLGLPASKEEGVGEKGARSHGSGPAGLDLVFVGLVFPQGEGPEGNLCLLGCRRQRPRHRGHGSDALFRGSFLDSRNCTIGLQLHYTTPKMSLRGNVDESLRGSLRPLPLSGDKPYLMLSSAPPAPMDERFNMMGRYNVLYTPTIAPQASDVCSNSKFMSSRPSLSLANLIEPLFGWTYPTAGELGFKAKHVQDAGGKHTGEPGLYQGGGEKFVDQSGGRAFFHPAGRRHFSPLDWLQGPGVGTEPVLPSLLATVLCTGWEAFAPLRSGEAVAEVNVNLVPRTRMFQKHCLKDVWVNNTDPANRMSRLSRVWESTGSGTKPETVALMLSLVQPVLMKANGTPASGALVGEGSYYQRTGKLCMLACLFREKAARRFTDGRDPLASVSPVGHLVAQEEIAPAAAPEVPEEDGPLDCQISVTIQYPKFQPWPITAMRAPLAGRIESLRQPQEAEYFAPHEFTAPSFMSSMDSSSATEGNEARQAFSVLVNSVAVVLVLLQTRHVKKNPTVGRHVSLYFVAMQVAGLALLILAALLQAAGDTWLAFLSSRNTTEPTLRAVLLLAYVRLFMRVRQARAHGGRSLTPEEEGGELELLLSEEPEQRELKDLQGGKGPLPPLPAAGEVAAGGAAGRAAANERPAFLLCIPMYVTLLLYGLIVAPFGGVERHRGGSFSAGSSPLLRCGFVGWALGFGGSSFLCLLGFALQPIGFCIRDLVLIPQLAFATLNGNLDLPRPPLARSYAYGILLCQLAMQHDRAGGMLCLLLQLVYYRVLCDGRRRGGKKDAASRSQGQERS